MRENTLPFNDIMELRAETGGFQELPMAGISVVFWISISLVGAIIACLRCESCPLYETICQVWSQTQLFSVSFYNQRLVRKRVLSTNLKNP